MQTTAPGQNRTGIAVSPKGVDLMLEAVHDLSPPVPISTLQMDMERQGYVNEADSVGSIPPLTATKKARARKDTVGLEHLPLFLDKLGERIAFERTGTRLYGAVISKYLALTNGGDDVLPAEDGESALDTLKRIQAEELAHFHLLCDAVVSLGGDPTAQTPCADVSAAASIGLMQVLTEPRTTLAQSLNTLLTAELTDNAGWELLAQLAEQAGHPELGEQFTQALEVEERHLEIVQGWLQTLLVTEAGTPAV